MPRFVPRNTPAQAYCSCCTELFVYFRTGRPRQRCGPCIEIEVLESNRFWSRHRSALRKEAASAHPA